VRSEAAFKKTHGLWLSLSRAVSRCSWLWLEWVRAGGAGSTSSTAIDKEVRRLSQLHTGFWKSWVELIPGRAKF